MENVYNQNEVKSTSYSMMKVFGWMFYAILLTGLTAFLLPVTLLQIGAIDLYLPILIGSAIAVLVLTIVTQIVIAKIRSKAVAIAMFSLFAIAMGAVLSSFILIYDIAVLGTSLLVTAGIFGVMALYGAITKRDLAGFGSFLFMLLIGSLVITIINFFIASTTIDWIVSYVLLAVYIGFIAYDVQNVKKLAESGRLNTNISLLMALNLYVDFIYVFMRIVKIVSDARN